MTYSVDTRAVHAGRADLAELGVHALPLDFSTTYPMHDQVAAGAALGAFADGAATAATPVYQRLYNPTTARFEQALAELEGTEAAVSFASGMAAITAVLQAACLMTERRHVVAVRPLYGGTDHLLSIGLLGLSVTWVEQDEVARAIRPDTGLVVVETPGNPTLNLVDIATVVIQAGDVPVLVDNTFATPVLQNPARLGAAYVVHSGTKYLGGHGDVLGGVVACAEQRAGALRQVRILTGAVLHPLAGYLLHRGLATLPLRVRAAQATAATLAVRLAVHKGISKVHYPGLPGNDPRGLIGRQMRGPGAMIAFETTGDAAAVVAALRLITPAVSLGSVDSLIEHPALLTHRLVDAEGKETGGITPNLLRMSVGLEDPEDLWADLDQALRAAGTRATVAVDAHAATAAVPAEPTVPAEPAAVAVAADPHAAVLAAPVIAVPEPEAFAEAVSATSAQAVNGSAPVPA
ncbi:trans-sulfuration enzyme family protein [Catellatospora coxensis]|uniref:homocysteine desulfhydrase n=1 Tax=Catellatospora coxensis TaxID=310354 RepID=A0A8J3KL79_9ACTN|nr:aminotransferase class I/II-fold pyridoxal phosphate-dependent enzyme [Catellatospora coxensis]GIG04643.1 cystathionine gamma-synthase [Catellatospora coxensis]